MGLSLTSLFKQNLISLIVPVQEALSSLICDLVFFKSLAIPFSLYHMLTTRLAIKYRNFSSVIPIF